MFTRFSPVHLTLNLPLLLSDNPITPLGVNSPFLNAFHLLNFVSQAALEALLKPLSDFNSIIGVISHLIFL